MFYTYLWLRYDGTPYYAGKGKGDRGFTSKGHRVRRPKDSSRIILQDWPSEKDAFEAEKFLIMYYGRLDLGTGCLRNLTDGGEGITGYNHTEETKQKLSESCKGYIPWSKGKTVTEEIRHRISEYRKGKIHTVETRRRMSESHMGSIHTEETRRKISESRKKQGRLNAGINRRLKNNVGR